MFASQNGGLAECFLLLLSQENRNTKGVSFEHFSKWFLENDPRYSNKLKKVWLWHEWPDKWGIDKGIDLIAETYEGEIWAVQAKAYGADHYITKEDVDKFLSESSRKIISFRLLIATTNKIGVNAQEVMQAQEKPVGLCLADSLNASNLDINCFLNNNKIAKKRLCIPYLHQEEALESILKGFGISQRGQLQMACGTGKTLVGLWLAERLASSTTLVLAPSISLLGQLFREWADNCSDNFRFSPLFVCSDKTIGHRERDAGNIHDDIMHLGFPVTTDLDQLSAVYKAISGTKVIFCTYQSSDLIKKMCEQNPTLSFDLVIADEAHRCAGRINSTFSIITDPASIAARRVLFMTATPKIFSEKIRKVAESYEYELVSMDDIKKFGHVFYRLPFSKAIEQNLLSDYKIVISVMDNVVYQQYAERGRFVTTNDGYETDARTLASQILVARAMKKYSLEKVITFHNSRKNARKFITDLPHALTLLPEIEKPNISYAGIILGEMPQSQRMLHLSQFKQKFKGAALLGNIKCLSEGVDVPALDGIAFIDPKGSEIDIVQAVGRVIRKYQNNDTKTGIIIIPLFINSFINDEEALEQSCFRPIAKVLKALRAHDDMLAEELNLIRFELGKRTYKNPPKLSKIIIDLPVNISTDFAENIQLRMVSGGIKIWRPFEEAREFAQQLKLQTSKEWEEYIKGNMPHLIKKPEDIPRAPQIVYKDRGWMGWGYFLGSGLIASQNRIFMPFSKARKFAHSLKFSNITQWRTWAKTNARPFDVPADPQAAYAKKGWTDWGDFLGTGTIAPQKRRFRSFEAAREYARKLQLKGQKEWQIFAKTIKKPNDIPTNPAKVYAKSGWKGWGDFLGTGNIAKMRREFKSFEEARDYIRPFRFKNILEFRAWTKTDACPSDIPHYPNETYARKGWKGNHDWLGIKND